MRRKLNVKFLLCLLAGLVVTSGGMALAHHLQYRRIPLAFLRQAQSAEKDNDLRRVDDYLTRYLAFEPTDTEQKARLARILTNPKTPGGRFNVSRAFFLLQDVLASDADRHDLRRLFVKLAIQMQRYPDAEDQLKVLPADAETAALWGRLYEARSSTEEAIEHYREALTRDPSNVETATSLVRLIRSRPWDRLRREERQNKRQADADEADRIMNELIRANPDSWQARIARWNHRRDYTLRHRRGERWSEFHRLAYHTLVQDASRDVTRALELREGEADVRLAAAEAAQLLGQHDVARTHLDRARQIHRKDARLFKAYAGLELQLADGKTSPEEKQQARSKAVSWLRQGARELGQPAQFEMQWALASLLLDGSTAPELDEAASVINKIRNTNINPAGADFLQGRLMMGRQQWAEAAALLKRCRLSLETTPDLANQIDLQLGRCFDELNDPKEQYETYKRMASRNPESITARLGMAHAARAMGQIDEALRLYGEATQVPDIPAAVWGDHVRLSIVKARQSNNAADWKRVEDLLAGSTDRKLVDDVERAILRAEYHYGRKEIDQARQVLEEAQKTHEQRVELWAARANLADRLKQPEEALKILEQASKTLTRPADDVEIRLARANHWVNRQAEQARVELPKLAGDLEKFEPDLRNRLLSGLAEANYRAGNFEEAGRLWKTLSQQEAYRADLRLRLMLFDLALQDNQEDAMNAVLAELKKLEGADGTFVRHAEALRLVWKVRTGKVTTPAEKSETLAGALRLLDQVAAARPTWSAVQLARAEVETLRFNHDQAIAAYRAAFEMGDRSPGLLRSYVEALRKHKRFAEADQLLTQRLKPHDLVRADLERAAARIKLHSHKPDEAIDLAFKAIRTESRDHRDHLWLGQLLTSSGRRSEKAEEHLRKAVEYGPREPETWVALVRFLVGQQRRAEVQEVLQQARKSVPAEKLNVALAQCHALMGQPDEARKFYQEALKSRPKDAALLADCAAFHLKQTEIAQAEELLRRLLANDIKRTPEETDWAHGRLGLILALGGNYARFKEALPHVGLTIDAAGELVRDESIVRSESIAIRRAAARVLATSPVWKLREAAIQRYEELEERQALSDEDRFQLARLYEAKNDWSKARGQLNRLAQAQDCDPEYLAFHVRALLAHKEVAQAQRNIDRLERMLAGSKLSKNDAILTELKARLHEARGEGQQAVELFRKRLASKDADPQEVLLFVSSLGRQQKFEEALELLDDVWKGCSPAMAGGTSVALLRACKSSEAQRKKVESLLRSAVEKDPKNIGLKVQLGDVLDLRGNYQEAEKEYREALTLEPGNPMALNNLAWLLALRASKGDEALQLINQALEKSGPIAELLDTRGVIHMTLGQHREALTDLQDAMKEAATPTRCFHLAQVHARMKEREAAARFLRQANELGLQAAQLHPVEQVAHRKLVEELNQR